jgi:NDP-sugar pyrophosphorylase family protein
MNGDSFIDADLNAYASRFFEQERDFFPKLAGKDLFGYCVERRFIDIGTPQSYVAAEDFFRSASKEA